MFPTTPEVLKEVLHRKRYSFTKSLLVTNGVGNTSEKKGLLFVEGEEPEVDRKLLLPAFPHAQIKRQGPEVWPKGVGTIAKRWRLCALPGVAPAVAAGRRGWRWRWGNGAHWRRWI